MQQLLVHSLFLIPGFLGAYVYCWYKHKQWKQNAHKLQEQLEKNQNSIQEHFNTIKKLESQIFLKEQEIARLEEYSLQLSVKEEQINKGINTLYKLKSFHLVFSWMNEDEKESLFTLTNLLYGDVIKNARHTHCLTESNLVLLSLLKFKFDNELLSFIFDCTGNTLSKRKQRLLKTLETPPKFDR